MGQDILAWLIAHLPFGGAIGPAIVIAGTCRIVFKLLFTFLDDVVKVTPTAYDDNLLASWEHSKVYTTISYLLDFFASVKLPSIAPADPATKPVQK